MHKIDITPAGMGSKITAPDGSEIKGVKSINIYATVDTATEANVTMTMVETTAECHKPNFIVGMHHRITHVIDDSGAVWELGKDNHEPVGRVDVSRLNVQDLAVKEITDLSDESRRYVKTGVKFT